MVKEEIDIDRVTITIYKKKKILTQIKKKTNWPTMKCGLCTHNAFCSIILIYLYILLCVPIVFCFLFVPFVAAAIYR